MITPRNTQCSGEASYNRLHGASQERHHSNIQSRSISSPNLNQMRVHFNRHINEQNVDGIENESDRIIAISSAYNIESKLEERRERPPKSLHFNTFRTPKKVFISIQCPKSLLKETICITFGWPNKLPCWSWFGDSRADNSRYRSFASRLSNSHDPNLEEVMRHYGLDESSPELPQTFSSREPSPPHSEHNQRLAAFGVRLSERLSHFVFAYPFIVLRRQCQVNHAGRKYHLTPFTVFGVALNMQRVQGFTCLWKGLGSCFMVDGITVAVETGLSELPSTKLPREVSSSSSLLSLVKHLVLKTCSMLVVIPFYSSHLVESVQSEMVSEAPGMFSCIFEGFRRLFGRHHSQRMLPFHRILVPTFTCAIIKYVLTYFLQHIILEVLRWRDRKTNPVKDVDPNNSSPTLAVERSTSLVKNHYPEVIAGLMADLIVDVILYPAETSINRITIQGTRTIIDNTDTGRGFLPVSSRYEGFWDCVSTTISNEGYSGLYRGFGALTLQYALKYAIARLTKLVLTVSC